MNAFGVEHTPISKRFFSEKAREKDAKQGDALPDGSFPIKNSHDLANAKRLVGHSKHPAAAEALIARKEKKFSKSYKTGLDMVANAGKLPDRAKMFGAKGKKAVDVRDAKIPAQRKPMRAKVDNTSAEGTL